MIKKYFVHFFLVSHFSLFSAIGCRDENFQKYVSCNCPCRSSETLIQFGRCKCLRCGHVGDCNRGKYYKEMQAATYNLIKN